MIILLFLTLSFHLTNIGANACDRYNITHFQQNDNITVNFSTNDLLKLNRRVRCSTSSSFESTNGCIHHCPSLGYGQHDRLTIEMEHNNGTIESCSIEYRIELQSPSLAYLNITNNKVRLGIHRPLDSFDYVQVHCSNNQSYIIFNTSIPSNNSLISVDCSFLVNTSLMNFVLETIKNDFVERAFTSINQEVPLPIQFTHSLNSRLLNVIAERPNPINALSTYEFQLIFYDKNTSYERIKVSNLNSNLNVTFNYGLIPNVNHTIIFKHILNPIGYSESIARIPPIVSNISYPFAITNLHVNEEFNQIILHWNDMHDLYDPIEYLVLCNSSENSMRNVGRNTTYICENMTFNQTNNISVRTQIAIPNYTHNRVAVQMNISQIPEIPIFEVLNTTENSITIRWNYNNNSLIINSFQYKIKCSSNETSILIDIQSNQYQCQSLDGGTLYIITISVENLNNTIRRSKSIYANTLLQKCRIQNHFYPPNLNGIRSVIIEWNPPENNIDKIHVYCPLSYITFQSSQIMQNTFVKCIIPNGLQYNVTFTTFKSGYESESIQFMDTPPVDPTTIVPITTEMSSQITTRTSPSVTTETSPGVTTGISTGITRGTSSEVTTRRPSTITTTSTGIIDEQTPLITSSERPPPLTILDCSRDEVLKAKDESAKWRTAAIVAFIMAGFLFLATICLIVFSTLLCLRNRYNDIDE